VLLVEGNVTKASAYVSSTSTSWTNRFWSGLVLSACLSFCNMKGRCEGACIWFSGAEGEAMAHFPAVRPPVLEASSIGSLPFWRSFAGGHAALLMSPLTSACNLPNLEE